VTALEGGALDAAMARLKNGLTTEQEAEEREREREDWLMKEQQRLYQRQQNMQKVLLFLLQ
jgi:Zn-finger nucleic acid-binding protein